MLQLWQRNQAGAGVFPAGLVVDCLPAPLHNTPPSTQNLLDHESRIFSRPARTWFQTEKEKKAAAAAAAAAQGKTALEMEAASGELLGLHVDVCAVGTGKDCSSVAVWLNLAQPQNQRLSSSKG